jgi:hypothetical protein
MDYFRTKDCFNEKSERRKLRRAGNLLHNGFRCGWQPLDGQTPGKNVNLARSAEPVAGLGV